MEMMSGEVKLLPSRTHIHTVTFSMSCKDEELLLLRDKDENIWDMNEVNSSVTILPQSS